MTALEISRKLIAMGKKGFCPNHQDNRLLMEAGKLIREMDQAIGSLKEQVYDLEERLAIREEMDHEGDPEIDAFPPEEDYPDAEAPGEAAEDFWGDGWPLEP